MGLAHKLKTARDVLSRYGVSEVFQLLVRNVTRVGRRVICRSGSQLGRLRRRVFPPMRHGRLRILYVGSRFEIENGETARYRIDNLRQALTDRCDTRFEIAENGIDRDRALLRWADIIVLMRTRWSEPVAHILDKAKATRIPVVFDVDDLLFSVKYADLFCRVLNDMSTETLRTFRSEFSDFARVFACTAFSTASTEFIAERMRQEGKEAFVIPNGFNRTQQRIAQRALKRPRPAGVRYIVYMSGTRTHDRDLQQAIPALTRVVQEYPDVRFRLIGYADETLLPPALAAKTDTVPFMSWKKLIRFAAENTINIAPLEVANPFCHAKSELKYFEAAIAGVPTVASPTDTFRRCIDSGVNGLLADGEEEWYTAFHTLLDDPARYAAIRGEAMRRAQAEYSPRAVAEKALAAYRTILRCASAKDSASAEK